MNNKDEYKLIILICRKKYLCVISWLFQRNKYFYLCLLEPKERVGIFHVFNFWYLPMEGLLHPASKTSLKVLVIVLLFLYINLAVLCLVFELKKKLEALVYPKMNSYITKTRLFKYTENFTAKKRKFSDKKIWFFSYFCSKHRLWVLVRTASMRRF